MRLPNPFALFFISIFVLSFAYANFFNLYAHSQKLHIAVASNFIKPSKELIQLFTKKLAYEVILTSGSSGKLYAQIIHGAPYDVLLSADQKYVKKLEKKGFAYPKSSFTYAIGKLVLWSSYKNKKLSKKTLSNYPFKNIAMANPKLSPYGKASKDLLNHFHIFNKYKKRIVYGENIAQTHQFIASKNAEVGFVAFSQIKNSNHQGSYWKIPHTLYPKIKQDAVILKSNKNRKRAKEWMKFLKSKKAKSMLLKYGYKISTGK